VRSKVGVVMSGEDWARRPARAKVETIMSNNANVPNPGRRHFMAGLLPNLALNRGVSGFAQSISARLRRADTVMKLGGEVC
jgi:hypothetical protein